MDPPCSLPPGMPAAITVWLLLLCSTYAGTDMAVTPWRGVEEVDARCMAATGDPKGGTSSLFASASEVGIGPADAARAAAPSLLGSKSESKQNRVCNPES
mmetsp:Transcript_58686/g.162280  ORF Transcript_58686/g.162280 Transcript_58686/m.162280 type:complete len:100 (-) Transcript_58686:1166-1465(-)